MPLVPLVQRQVFQLDLGNKLLEVLVLAHELLNTRLTNEAELNGNFRGLVDVWVLEPDRDVNCEHVLRRGDSVGEERGDQAMPSLQFELEQGVKAVLSAAGECRELRERGASMRIHPIKAKLTQTCRLLYHRCQRRQIAPRAC